jgi:hypothetical protein
MVLKSGIGRPVIGALAGALAKAQNRTQHPRAIPDRGAGPNSLLAGKLKKFSKSLGSESLVEQQLKPRSAIIGKISRDFDLRCREAPGA